MPSYRKVTFFSALTAFAALVLLTAYLLPNLTSGIDAIFHGPATAMLRGWGAALNADPSLVQKLNDGVYGEARVAISLLTLALMAVFCFRSPRVTKVEANWWLGRAFVTFVVFYIMLDILSLKTPTMLQTWIDGSGFVIGRLLYVLNGQQASIATQSAFGSMLVVLQVLSLWLLITWLFRRK